MTDERLRMLADIYPKMKDFYVKGNSDMMWSPILLGGCHRPTFAEFINHSRYTWTHKDVIDTQRAMQKRHEIARMKREEADA